MFKLKELTRTVLPESAPLVTGGAPDGVLFGVLTSPVYPDRPRAK